jgi:cysteinyl-tRNA synthetase
MKSAQNGFKKLQNQVKAIGNEIGTVNQKYKKQFIEKISDNFNFPQAMAVIYELLKSNLKDKDKFATILDFDKVLGLNLDKIQKENRQEKVSKNIQKLIEQRNQARLKKDWKQADEIREKILKMGYKIEDTKKVQNIFKVKC